MVLHIPWTGHNGFLSLSVGRDEVGPEMEGGKILDRVEEKGRRQGKKERKRLDREAHDKHSDLKKQAAETSVHDLESKRKVQQESEKEVKQEAGEAGRS